MARAQGLDPCNPDIYLLLGQIYSDSGRAEDAQAALRKSIAFTIDVRRNNFQVQRAHYLLGRLLMQSGQTDEARKEMKAAEELLRQSTAATQGVEPGAGTAASTSKIQGSVAFAADALQQARILEARISGAVADSYNNLGAMAATNGDFPTALLEFRQAAQWNPLLEGLDYNWARAAFSAGEYEEAIGPLTRQLVKNPDDRWTHSALGSSYFSLKQYAEAVRTLRQVESSPGASPQLDYIYAVSQIRSGEMDAGVERLEALERANPEIAPIAEALAEAYAARGQSEKAGLAKRRAESLRARSASSKQKSN